MKALHRYNLANLFALLLICQSQLPSLAQSSIIKVDELKGIRSSIANVYVVSPMLARGGQPSANGLAQLKKAGIKTVINLRNEDVLVSREAKIAQSLGLKYVNIPLNEFDEPSVSDVSRFLSLVNDPEIQPVYVHCLHGQDRTGAMIAIYRISSQGWTTSRAYQEMLELGFHPEYVNLSHCIFDYAESIGRRGQPPPADLLVRDMKDRLFKLLHRE